MAEWMRLTVRRFFKTNIVEAEWSDRIVRATTERELVDQIHDAIIRAWEPAAEAEDGHVGPDRASELWQRCLDAVQRFHGLPGDDGTLDTVAAERLAEVLWRYTLTASRSEDEKLSHDELVQAFAKDMVTVQRVAAKGRTKWPKRAMFRFPVWNG